MKHTVTINVTDEYGKSRKVMKSRTRKLPARLLKFLFGDFSQVYLLKPGTTVDSVDIREIQEGGTANGQSKATA